MRGLAGWLALALGGCFSGANFDECTRDEHCGPEHECRSGRCEPATDEPLPSLDAGADASTEPADAGPDRPDTASPPDAGPLPDAGGERVVTGDIDEADRVIDAPGERVVLRDVNIRASYLSVEAREIVVEGRIRADGAGHPGGGGGGGGGAGHTSLEMLPGEGGEQPKRGFRGVPNSSLVGGDGGDGGDGSGAVGGLGGPGGTGAGRAGEIGRTGRFAQADFDACGFDVGLRLGSGGGGGGGGAGSDGLMCRSGGGGGGGGSGGPGGGALHLRASERIVVRGELSARGVAILGGQRPADPGGEACPGAEPPAGCADGCDPAVHGRGGAGGAASFSAQAGGEGGAVPDGEPGGRGGDGGGGGGGMVRLMALEILFEAGARIDVSGSDGETNGGLAMVRGQVAGEVQIDGAAFRCVE